MRDVYVCVCVCMYLCMYVCIYVCMYVRTYVCMYVCMYIYMYVCMYICMYVMPPHTYLILNAPTLISATLHSYHLHFAYIHHSSSLSPCKQPFETP